jgi:uncharacterized protein with HEPN domain
MEKDKFIKKSAGEPLFSYQGPITSDFTRSLLNALENQLHIQDASPKFRRNVFTVVTEAMQNIEKYALETTESELQPSVVITNSDNGFIFTIGNAITRVSYPEFKRRLDFISKSSITDLRNEYLKQLFDVTSPDGTSAGLGLLAIAIRANKMLEYTFTEVNENCLLVLLVITTER